MRNFKVMVGPYNRAYKQCGFRTNTMNTYERREIWCSGNTIGTTVKISIKGRNQILTLCEVLIFGRGKLSLKFIINLVSFSELNGFVYKCTQSHGEVSHHSIIRLRRLVVSASVYHLVLIHI